MFVISDYSSVYAELWTTVVQIASSLRSKNNRPVLDGYEPLVEYESWTKRGRIQCRRLVNLKVEIHWQSIFFHLKANRL